MRSSTQVSVPQPHERIWRIRSHGTSEIPRGRHTCYFLPHHPVYKETNTTTKTQGVFDGGAKTSNGMSINDILQVGPTVQQDLYSIVLRFRIRQVCFIADIEKCIVMLMYIHKTEVYKEFFGDILLKNPSKSINSTLWHMEYLPRHIWQNVA